MASLIMIGMMVFGSLEYFIEMDEEDTGFYSIPQGMWWAVQTLTSLGYGDFPVETISGKLMGSLCAVCGVLVMALPIPIVVDNFADYYSEQKKLEAKDLKEEAQALENVWLAEVHEASMKGLKDTVLRTDPASSQLPDPRVLNNGEPKFNLNTRNNNNLNVRR